MILSHLQVNHFTEPLGADLRRPVFSWVVSDSRSEKQEAARLRVWRGDECLCDTGFDGQLDSLGTELPLALAPRTRYAWRADVRGDRGDEAESATAQFETGKMDEPWLGRWLRAVADGNCILEREFELPEQPYSARLYISGLGLFRAFINNEAASDEVLMPGFTAYDRWIQVQTCDVGRLLRAGRNRIGIWLGGGISRGRFSYTPEDGYEYSPYDCAIAELHVFSEAGETVFATDESWRWRRSPILESSIYNGEVWDPGVAHEGGRAILCPPPAGELRDRLSPPLRIIEERKPLRILRTPKGETVLDAGENVTGWLRFRAAAPKGTALRLQYGEQLENGCFSRANLRSARAAFEWRCDGNERMAEPFFTWYGFRYVLLEGFGETPAPEDFTVCIVSSELEQIGSLQTGHEKLNRLIANIRRSQLGNFLDVPTDCPQRDEREGWTGDAQVFADTACFHMDCAAFFTKYLADMWEEQQKAGGCVPIVVPYARNRSRGFEGGAVGWSDAASILPWTLWLHYGDRSLLRRQLPNMEAWTDWVMARKDWPSEAHHFGDWLALDRPEEPRERMGKTDLRFLCLSYAFYSAGLTAKAEAALGNSEMAARYRAFAETRRRELQRDFFAPDGTILCRTQTACVIALHLGFAPDAERTRSELRALVRETGHLTTGFLGTPWLLFELPAETAWALLLREEYPSWLYEVNLGATTIWERWNSLTDDGCFSETGMNSLNHYAYGSVGAWLYRAMSGLSPMESAPGFRRFQWSPEPDVRVGSAVCTLRSPCGVIRSTWRFEGENLFLSLTVPFGAEAEFRLPDGRTGCLRAGTHTFRAEIPDLSGKRLEDGA